MRILKITLLALIGLITLLLLSIVAITATIDPNDYKADIESAVAQNTTLRLSINGDLGWSFIPLGVDVNSVKLEHSNGKPFTELNQLTAQVGLLSLLKFNPQVHKLILDGLTVTLEKNEKGEANWENITAKKEDTSNQKSTPDAIPSDNQKQATPTDVTDTSTKGQSLQLEIEEVAITNTTIHYIDKQTNQSASLEGFSLLANNIALGSEFPLNIEFNASNSAPELTLEASINAALTINSDLKHFAIKQLQSNYQIAGAPFNNKQVTASINGDNIIADMEKGTVELDKIALKLANLALNTHITMTNLNDQPQLNGNLEVPNFSLQELLSSIGQPAIETTDPEVLKHLGFSTKINGSLSDLKLEDMVIQLDGTRYTGLSNYRLDDQFVAANLRGSKLNIDRYLPPPADPVTQVAQVIDSTKTKQDAATPSATSSKTQSTEQESPLLPLDVVRALNLDISFVQEQLIVKNLKLNDLTLLLKAGDGIVTLTEASGKLYEGNFDVNAKIDATSDTPTWAISKKVNNIQIMPLLKDYQELEIISGGLNLNADVKTAGNTVSALRSAAKGNANFNFDKGAFHGFNLTKITCEGIALINKDKVTKSDWADKSEFQAMKGALTINGNQFTNNNLTAAMSGLAVIGKGVIDTETTNINYGVDIKAIGELGDNACRVNDKVKGLAIPVICKGSLSDDPAKLCQLDGSRMQELVVAAGKKELKRKADKEINKQLDKHLGDDSETKKSVKKLIEGLF
ncbi:AsmA family protein [Alkalimarinus coralli]|uniref:AsmA family protein n=1 Tax=Alkalimarinus coralli TaxID=2935863 RepID=UPI00202B0479|nr:AsmA family protein [Alkalimarinus coralli]